MAGWASWAALELVPSPQGQRQLEGQGNPGENLEGNPKGCAGLGECRWYLITGDHLGFCKLKRAQATSSAEEEINRLIYGTQMRALPGRHSL